MTCGCDSGDCALIDALLAASAAQMAADGHTGFGRASLESVGRQIDSLWTAMSGSLGVGLTLSYPSTGATAGRVNCYLAAFLRFVRGLALCQIIPAGPQRDQCMTDRKDDYLADIADCDTNHPV